ITLGAGSAEAAPAGPDRLTGRRALIVMTLALLPVAGGGVSAWRAARVALETFSPPRGVPLPPAGVAVEHVTWSAAGATIAGWYAPSQNRAAVILTHGSSADRSQLNTEFTALARAGFGVLAFDWPGHGESG